MQTWFDLVERIGSRSWQRTAGKCSTASWYLFKDPFGSLWWSHEGVATYLFVTWVVRFRRQSNWLFMALYLNTCAHSLQVFDGGSLDRTERYSVNVSLTRSGLPQCIPSLNRNMIKRRDARADLLSFLFHSFRLRSWSRSLQNGPDPLWNRLQKSGSSVKIRSVFFYNRMFYKDALDLLHRYIPWASRVPLNLGLVWLLSWKSVPSIGSNPVFWTNAFQAWLGEVWSFLNSYRNPVKGSKPLGLGNLLCLTKPMRLSLWDLLWMPGRTPPRIFALELIK